jgi:hypothetical protein
MLIVVSAAQQPTAKRTPGFQWNSKESQEARDTVRASKGISPAERAMLLNALAARFKGDPNPKSEAEDTRVRLVDLNGDGVPEVISQASGDICSPTGNCPFWAFQKTGTQYRLILEKGAVQDFTIQPTQTNGYFDLVLGMHGSATEQGLFLYQFRDGRYRRAGCYDANWTYLGKDGEYHNLKQPRITPCKM